MKNIHRQLERSLGYRFKCKRILETALIHPSYRHENKSVEEDNQRLEFLGDAALEIVVAEHLFKNFDLDEGVMTEMRSKITCTTALADLARSIELGQYLILGKGEAKSSGADRDSNLADALESIAGAAFVDGGHKAVKKIFTKLFLPALETSNSQYEHNPKGALQELCQESENITPIYHLVMEKGPAHAKRFIVEVSINGVTKGRGTGSSKRSAEKIAARTALDNLTS